MKSFYKKSHCVVKWMLYNKSHSVISKIEKYQKFVTNHRITSERRDEFHSKLRWEWSDDV